MLKQGPLSGKTLGGKYLLGDLLGKGGFGVVYQAENQLLRRQQAVKVLLEEHFSDEKFRDRFLREARTLGALDHASIVHVDDIGMEGNFIYLVMPYISGGTLQDLLKARSGPLGVEEVTRYLEQICSALGYAHAQGVVHLDLKPLNLLVHRDGRLLLSDFGLAHLMEQGAIEGGTSLQFGSPLYMAPEHFDGKPSQRSDLYALGVILYQMLAGRHPFEASTPAAVMRKHLTEPPPSLQTARPDLPVALDAVIAKALAKQPEERYGRVGELLFDYRAALAGQALEFSSSAEQTQRAQLYLDSTQRAMNPPVEPARPGWAGSGPATPPSLYQPGAQQATPVPAYQPVVTPAPPAPAYQPVAQQVPPPGYYTTAMPGSAAPVASLPPGLEKLKLWTPGFIALCVVVALLGLVVTVLLNVRIGNMDFTNNNDYAAVNSIGLIIVAVVALTCFVALLFMNSVSLRVGLLLQFGSLISNIILSALFLHLDTGGSFDDAYGKWVYIYLPLLFIVLNAASFIVLSYGIGRWQKTRDPLFTVLQVVFSGILVVILASTVHLGGQGDDDFWLQELGGSVSVLWFGVAVTLFAAAVFLLRPDRWKQHRALTILVVVGLVLFVFQGPGGYLVLEHWFPSLVTFYRVLFTTYGLSFVLFMLGILVLVQTERMRRKAQQAIPAPALAR